MAEIRGVHGDEMLRAEASEALDAYWREKDKKIARALTQFSYEPSTELRTLEDDLTVEFTKRCRRWQVEPPERPVVSYVASANALEFKRAVDIKNMNIKPGEGNWLPVYRRIILIGGDTVSSLRFAESLSHELDHAYRRTVRYGELEKDDDTAASNLVPSVSGGCRIDNRHGTYGAVLEEGHIIHNGLQRRKSYLSEQYPSEYALEQKAAANAVRSGRLDPEDLEFFVVLSNSDSRNKAEVTGISLYKNAARLTRFIAGELPNGWELMEKMCVTGKHHEFARVLEDRFGVGAFRVVMSIPDFSEGAISLARKYLETPPGEERENIARELLASRPHDADRHERRIKIADMNKKE